MNDTTAPPPLILTPLEARILACLMEKELTTADNYPLTLNSLTLACNQKSSREPVMNLSLAEVNHGVKELDERELLRIEYGDRAQRISQRLRQALKIDRRAQAVLAVLMLRRPQTLNEIRIRTERMVEFEGTEEIEQILAKFMQRQPPLAICLPRGAGQREDRYAHLLCGEPEIEALPPEAEAPRRPVVDADRMEQLEARVATLERQVAELLERLSE